MPIVVFLIIAFTVSWAIAGLLYSAGGFEGAGATAGLYLTAMMFGPSIAALITAALYDRRRFFRALGLSGYRFAPVALWMLAGWLIPVLLCAAALMFAGLFNGTGFANPVETMGPQIEAALSAQGQSLEDLPMSIDMLVITQLAVGLPIGILVNTVLLLITEELGWRGWLQPRLMRLGFWPMCLVSGLIWGVWHAPIIAMGYNYPGMPVTGPLLMVVFCVLLTPYAALLRERGASYAAAAFHGSLNAVAGVSLLFLARGGGEAAEAPSWLWNGIMGLPGFAVMLAGWAVIFLIQRTATGPDSAAIIAAAPGGQEKPSDPAEEAPASPA